MNNIGKLTYNWGIEMNGLTNQKHKYRALKYVIKSLREEAA